jgi:hypothetical protein
MAQENRDMRMNEAEKKAAALPPKLTVPMIVFFLPVLFVVILGPTGIKVSEYMKYDGYARRAGRRCAAPQRGKTAFRSDQDHCGGLFAAARRGSASDADRRHWLPPRPQADPPSQWTSASAKRPCSRPPARDLTDPAVAFSRL